MANSSYSMVRGYNQLWLGKPKIRIEIWMINLMEDGETQGRDVVLK